jgi:hypothetical protein
MKASYFSVVYCGLCFAIGIVQIQCKRDKRVEYSTFAATGPPTSAQKPFTLIHLIGIQ